MNKNTTLANKVGMEILNFKVINLDRWFKNLMLNPFNNYKLAIGKYKNISCTKIFGKCPAKLFNIERVIRRCWNCFAVNMNMNQFIGFIDIGFSYSFNWYFTGCFIFWKNFITDFNFLYGLKPILSSYKRYKYKEYE